MAHNDFKSLVLDLAEEFNNILLYKDLLNIAVEQLEPDCPKTVNPLKLLVELFTQLLDCHSENIEMDLKRLKRLPEFLKVDDV